MKSRHVITVDGLAGSGKTALSSKLAESLSYAHFNSGLLYRAVGYLLLRDKVDPDDEAAVGAVVGRHAVKLDLGDSGKATLFIDGKVVDSERLLTPEVSEAASRSSRHKVVREALIGLQRSAFPGRDIVAEGRDMGTVVFPDADLKFYIEADQRVRIQRRVAQLYVGADAKDKDSLEKQINIEILERDKRDLERAISPAKPAPDAIIIDNGSQKLTEVLQSMYHHASLRGLVS